MLAVAKKRRSLSDREPEMLPGSSNRLEHDVEEHQQGKI